MLLGVPSRLVAVTCALPGVVPACCVPGAPLWRARVCGQGRCQGCGLYVGLLAWFCQLSCAVGSVLILCTAAVCARCLQSLLAAGSLRSLFCPDASSALCPVLHTTYHLDVSNTHTQPSEQASA